MKASTHPLGWVCSLRRAIFASICNPGRKKVCFWNLDKDVDPELQDALALLSGHRSPSCMIPAVALGGVSGKLINHVADIRVTLVDLCQLGHVGLRVVHYNVHCPGQDLQVNTSTSLHVA